MRRIYRSEKNSMIAGVCGGLGEMLDVDPTIIRLMYVFATIFTGLVPLIVTYVLGWIIIPTASEIEAKK